jgi:D-sedoheptulose 7-phosphate isomerase
MENSDCRAYLATLRGALESPAFERVPELARALAGVRERGNCVYLCGNGGSGGNALHLANDLIFGAGGKGGHGLRVEALPANAAVLTCLANDLGYAEVFSRQLRIKGRPGDLLIVLSGSGNSPNVVRALETAKELGVQSAAILAFGGGRCAELADIVLHFELDDMQVAEDLQLVVGHMIVQWLARIANESTDA